MAFITSFIYCRDPEELQIPSQAEVIKPMQVIRTKYIPTYFTFSIACVIYGTDFAKENRLNLCFRNPEGEVVLDTGEASINKREDNTDLLQINVEFRNVVLKEAGIYRTEVKINNELLGSYPIPVIKDVE